ncbi:MAG: orotidine-5'-phosphate decarboxylase [Actinobacteria bacterium]|nr:orotidine-5'-phosphate decarboxylase [Actinomycetota bacterium]
MKIEERLIVALDFDSASDALAMVGSLGETISFYKVGLQLFLAGGMGIVQVLKQRGKRVFLDLKFHDIPSQVASSCREAVRLGADMLTVHALGGEEMIAAAVDASKAAATSMRRETPYVMAVTILTSLDEDAVEQVGLGEGVQGSVARLALLAARAGASGAVASPREIEVVKKAAGTTARRDFTLLTPGIRRSGERVDEQRRSLTPGEAISKGADFLVVGRPITRSKDPKMVAESIIEEMRNASKERRQG